MIRLALDFEDSGAPFLAAATRLRDVIVVTPGQNPDALIIDRRANASATAIPTLCVDAIDAQPPTHVFPALRRRFDPDVLAIKERIRSSSLGVVGLIRAHTWRSTERPLSRLDRIEHIDRVLWLLEEHPASVYHVHPNQFSTVFHLGFPSGAMAILDYSNSLQGNPTHDSLCVLGSKGAAYSDERHNRQLVYQEGQPSSIRPDLSSAYIQPMIEEFLNTVRQQKPAHERLRAYRLAEDVADVAEKRI